MDRGWTLHVDTLKNRVTNSLCITSALPRALGADLIGGLCNLTPWASSFPWTFTAMDHNQVIDSEVCRLSGVPADLVSG